VNVSHYSFGSITIDGTTYTSDVIIYRDRVDATWWRKEGHNLSVSDLAGVIAASPEVVIIGTGAYGIMRVPQETADHLRSKGIEVYVEKTKEAVELFNRVSTGRKSVAALHLTC
jgi:hypothetical protein